ncbi:MULTISPECIES: hypothetical protein [Dickeya]|uniref:hypothetical protein n=1 Tax=Dickeya TaxID=204037 RepID=UPI001D15194B|nr:MULTISPECIES: hypothetical protein [Dickeya]
MNARSVRFPAAFFADSLDAFRSRAPLTHCFTHEMVTDFCSQERHRPCHATAACVVVLRFGQWASGAESFIHAFSDALYTLNREALV